VHVVLILDHARVNGGQAKVAIDSALGLRRRGHQVTVFAAVGPVDPRLPDAGVEVICLGQDDVETTRNKAAFAAQVIWNATAAVPGDSTSCRISYSRSVNAACSARARSTRSANVSGVPLTTVGSA